MKECVMHCKDDHKLFYRVWLPEEEPIAVVHILHGMAEHSLRYDSFALYLNSLNFAVFAQDHRGHGHTKAEDEKGWFADSDGWDTIAADSWELDKLILNTYPDLPLFLFGHSMGSFLARTMIVKHPDDYAAAVISGTGPSMGFLGKIGAMIARSHAKKFGPKMPDEALNKMSFGSYNKKVQNPKTESDWLTRDAEEVQKYIKDPLCGFVCSSSFYADLLEGIEFANSKENAERVNKHLPMLIISGDKDPVGSYGDGVKKVYELYKKAGVTDLTLKLIPEARHEILNEIDKNDTIAFIGDWLFEKVKK